MNFTNKVVLITGASQGLGKSLAGKLAVEGATVILLARTATSLQKIITTINSKNGKAEAFVCDITDTKVVQHIVKTILKKYTRVDILINNAGIWTDDEIEKNLPERRNYALDTNIAGQINITEELLPHLKIQKQAIIFNVISTAGIPEIPAGDNRYWKTYGASKWGFTGYTHALRESLRETKIKVIQYFPGGFDSNLYTNAHKSYAHEPWMMKTDDVADIVLFALSRPDDVYMEKIVVSKQME